MVSGDAALFWTPSALNSPKGGRARRSQAADAAGSAVLHMGGGPGRRVPTRLRLRSRLPCVTERRWLRNKDRQLWVKSGVDALTPRVSAPTDWRRARRSQAAGRGPAPVVCLLAAGPGRYLLGSVDAP